MKCKIHNIEKKQGGCFQNIYEWCPKCEDADTEPLTDPGRELTPTAPLRLDGTFYTTGIEARRIRDGKPDAWVCNEYVPGWIAVEVRGPVLQSAPGFFLVAVSGCRL